MRLDGLTIAFDLDGTLVDTAPDLIGALNHILEEHGLAPTPVASARALVGRGARALIERGFESAGVALEPHKTTSLVTRFIEIYRERIARESRPFEGVEAALSELSAHGALLCVCTNKPTALAELLLKALDLRPRFASVVGADAAPRPKPDPSHLRHTVAQAGGLISRAIMVGDSETDVATAKAAQTPVVAVSFGYTLTPPKDLGADCVIDRFEDLPRAVLSILPALNAKRASAIGTGSPATGGDA
jgi:phosphoglycolate phosphatase